MSDIFINYSSEARARVQPLARALEQNGWSVWWDRRILTGRSFDEVIEEELDTSTVVVVVWTPTSWSRDSNRGNHFAPNRVYQLVRRKGSDFELSMTAGDIAEPFSIAVSAYRYSPAFIRTS